MSFILEIENSTYKVRSFRDRIWKMPCRGRMFVRSDSEANVTEKSST